MKMEILSWWYHLLLYYDFIYMGGWMRALFVCFMWIAFVMKLEIVDLRVSDLKSFYGCSLKGEFEKFTADNSIFQWTF